MDVEALARLGQEAMADLEARGVPPTPAAYRAAWLARFGKLSETGRGAGDEPVLPFSAIVQLSNLARGQAAAARAVQVTMDEQVSRLESLEARISQASKLTDLRGLQVVLARESSVVVRALATLRHTVAEAATHGAHVGAQLHGWTRGLVELPATGDLDLVSGLPDEKALGAWAAAELFPAGAVRGFCVVVAHVDATPDLSDDGVVELAHRLKLGTRDTDFVARTGSGCFVMVLPSCDLSIAHSVAERLRGLVSRRPLARGGAEVSLALGAAVSRPAEAFSDVVSRADECAQMGRRRGAQHVVSELERP